jgi:stage V sporulation protein B
VALGIMAVLGLLLFSVMFFGADLIASRFHGLDGAVHAVRAIAPALLFVPVMATFRGYFQGMQNMKPTAISQIVEQFFRVVFGLALAIMLLPQGEALAAAGGTFGAAAGAVAGLILMLIFFLRRARTAEYRQEVAESRLRFSGSEPRISRIIYQIFAIAVPITIGAAIMPILQNIDLVIVTSRLASSGAWAEEQIRSMYGQLTAFAAPIINLPFMVIQAVTISMVPTVVSAFRRRDMEFLHLNIRLGIRTALILGLPCAVGMMTLATPIMRLLYPLQTEDALQAAPCLFILAMGIVFLASSQILTAVLQGVGRQVVPVLNLLIGAVVKAVITYCLTGIPSVNIKGAALGTICAYAVAAFLNFRAVRKETGTTFNWRLTLGKPLKASLVMGLVVIGVYQLLIRLTGNLTATGISILIGGGVYLIMVFITGSITKEELSAMPKGERLVKIYEKVLTKGRRNGRM